MEKKGTMDMAKTLGYILLTLLLGTLAFFAWKAIKSRILG